jgi:hypothetical protein
MPDYYCRFRHFASNAASWSSADPLKYYSFSASVPQIRALPAYARSLNPIHHVDPWGLADYVQGMGGDLGNNISGGIGLDTCVHLDIPLRVQVGWLDGLSFGMDFCRQKYDTKCCNPPATANECTTVRGKLGATVGLPSDFNWREWADSIGDAVNMLIGLFGGTLNTALLGNIPVRGCPSAGRSFDLGICLNACATFMSVKICGSISGVTVDVKAGFCGLPRVSINIQGEMKDCY